MRFVRLSVPVVGVCLFEGDLRQHRPGNVAAGLCVVDENVLAPLHHCREFIERHYEDGKDDIETRWDCGVADRLERSVRCSTGQPIDDRSDQG